MTTPTVLRLKNVLIVPTGTTPCIFLHAPCICGHLLHLATKIRELFGLIKTESHFPVRQLYNTTLLSIAHTLSQSLKSPTSLSTLLAWGIGYPNPASLFPLQCPSLDDTFPPALWIVGVDKESIKWDWSEFLQISNLFNLHRIIIRFH